MDPGTLINWLLMGLALLAIVGGFFRLATDRRVSGVIPYLAISAVAAGASFMDAGGIFTELIFRTVGTDTGEQPRPPSNPGPGLPHIDSELMVLVGIGAGSVATVAIVAWVVYHLTGKIRADRADQRAIATAAAQATAAIRARWDRAEQTYRELQQHITDADHSLDVLLSTPLLIDGTFQPTRDAWHALEAAQLRQQTGYSGIASTEALEAAVSQLGVAWKVAKTSAASAGLNKMSPEERKSVRTARKLLASAEDPGTSPALRAQYYAKAQDTLAGLQSLAHISQKFTEAIEPARRQAIAAQPDLNR